VDDIVVSTEIAVAAPPEAVWPLVDDPEAVGRWLAFADRMELLDGAGVGRRQRLYGHWGKKRSEIDQRVVEHDPPSAMTARPRLAWVHEAERLDGRPAPRFSASTRFTIELSPTAQGCLVRLESRQEPASRWRGLVIRAFGVREVRQRLEASARELADTVCAR
jgi:uncharacterized protein YndB with AHSA1/START domain